MINARVPHRRQNRRTCAPHQKPRLRARPSRYSACTASKQMRLPGAASLLICHSRPSVASCASTRMGDGLLGLRVSTLPSVAGMQEV